MDPRKRGAEYSSSESPPLDLVHVAFVEGEKCSPPNKSHLYHKACINVGAKQPQRSCDATDASNVLSMCGSNSYIYFSTFSLKSKSPSEII